MKYRLLILFILLFVLTAAACQADGRGDLPVTGGELPLLDDRNWVAASVEQEGQVPGTRITAQFDGQDMMGNAGCNSYTASYQIDQDRITISPPIQTEIACLDPAGVMEQEQRFLGALSEVSSYRFVNREQVEFLDQEGRVRLVLTADS
jgi:heat shock protein HslJ